MLFTPRLLMVTSRLSTPFSGRSSGWTILSFRSWPRDVTAMPPDLHAVIDRSPSASSAMTAIDRTCLLCLILFSFKLHIHGSVIVQGKGPASRLSAGLQCKSAHD